MTAVVTQYVDSKEAVFKLSDGSVIRDISASIISADFPSAWKNNDITAFGSLGKRVAPGIYETKFTLELIMNQVALVGSHTVVGNMHSAKATRAFEYYPFGTATGNLKITGNCNCPTFHIKAKMGDVLFVTAEFEVDNGLTYGISTLDYIFEPTIDAYGDKSHAVYATAQGAATADNLYTATTFMKLGQQLALGSYFIYRGFLYFNTAALAGKTIVAAYLNLYGALDESDADFDLQVTNGQATYPHDPLVVADFAIANYSGDGGKLNSLNFVTGAYNLLTLNATGRGWINQTGVTKLALVSAQDIAATAPAAGEAIWIYSSEQGVGFKPQLIVSTT